jgi:hypothetical protein
MPVALVGTPTNTGNDISTSARAPAAMAGTLANDIAVVFLSRWQTSAKTAVTAPSGFTTSGIVYHSGDGNADIAVYWKRLTGTDSGTYSFSWSGAFYAHANCLTFRGCVTTGDPIEAITSWSGTAGTFGTTSIAVVTAAALLWKGYNDTNGTHLPPGGFTEIADTDCGTAAYRLPGAPGNYSAVGATVTSSSSSAAVLLGLKSADAVPQQQSAFLSFF